MTTHFWKGDASNSIAIILSTPGKDEGDIGRPAAGETGNNLNAILKILNTREPAYFKSVDRYYYLITNASTKVIHSSKNNGKTEDLDSNIIEKRNIERIQNEIKKCSIIILCGAKAKLLSDYLSDKILITAPHLGNKGLRNEYKNNNPCLKDIKTTKERHLVRLKLCAERILEQLQKRIPELSGCPKDT